MVETNVRLTRMLEQDKVRQKQAMFLTLGLLAVMVLFTLVLDVFWILPFVLVGQVPMLYKGWHRMRLLLTFNDESRYRRLVRQEFGVQVVHTTLLLLFIGSVLLGWMSLVTFIVFLFISLCAVLVIGFRIDRHMKEVDVAHVTGTTLNQARLERKS